MAPKNVCILQRKANGIAFVNDLEEWYWDMLLGVLCCELERLPGGLGMAEPVLCVDPKPRPPLPTLSREYMRLRMSKYKDNMSSKPKQKLNFLFLIWPGRYMETQNRQQEMHTGIYRHDLSAGSIILKCNKARELSHGNQASQEIQLSTAWCAAQNGTGRKLRSICGKSQEPEMWTEALCSSASGRW